MVSRRLFSFLSICSLFVLISCEEVFFEITDAHTSYLSGVEKVLIIGNSITKTPKAPDLGWYGDWGMAASDSSKDYVHILTERLQSIYPSIDVKASGKGVIFERNYESYDLESEFSDLKAYEADLIILRLGENVNPGHVFEYGFKQSFREFAEYFRKFPDTPVICISGFWPNKYVNEIIQRISYENGYFYSYLHDLGLNKKNRANKNFNNQDVGNHPGDRGMKLIADRIWVQIGKVGH